MDDGNPASGLAFSFTRKAFGDLHQTADIAGGDDPAAGFFQVFDLARLQPSRQFGLQQIKGAGGATTKMPFGRFQNLEPGAAQQIFRLLADLLSVLHGARRMIGHGWPGLRGGGAKNQVTQDFGNVARQA